MNKIIVSIVFAVILVLGINKVSDVIFYVEKPEKSAYQVASVTTVANTTSAEASLETGNIMAVFASTSAAEGAKVFKKCAACHSINKGGKSKIGPALWGVTSRNSGEVDGYKYSKALKSYGKQWNFEELNGFLLKPAKWIKGNKMGFAGLKKDKDRASVILYLNENSDNPIPLP